MPKININGITREMTPDEIAELERLAAYIPPPEPIPEERIAKLEEENAHLREALELILSGVTEVVENG